MNSQHRGEPSAAELERDIERSRARIVDLANTLSHRLEPNNLIDEAVTTFRRRGGDEAARKVGRTIRDYPLAVAAAGLSIGYVAHLANRSERTSGDVPRWDRRFDEFERNTAVAGAPAPIRTEWQPDSEEEGMMSRMKAAGESARESVAEYAARARREISALRHRAANGDAGIQDMARDHPLVLAGLGLGLGALLGSLLPSTRTEDEWIGPYGDQLRDYSRERSLEEFERAKAAAQNGVERLKRHVAHGDPGTPASMGQTAAGPAANGLARP